MNHLAKPANEKTVANFSIVNTVRRRRTFLLMVRGLAICLVIAAALLLAMGYAAHNYRNHNTILILLRIGSLVGVLASIFFFLVQPLRRRASDVQIARLVEEHHPALGDRLVTAIEVLDQQQHTSPEIAERLVKDANQQAQRVDVNDVVARKRLISYALAGVLAVLIFAGVLKFGPKPLSAGLAQLFTPTSSAASTNAFRIIVRPGTAKVPKGSDQRIIASLVNFDSQEVTFYVRSLAKDASGREVQWDGKGMEPAKNKSDFQFFIFNIQDPIEYFVESNGVKSEVFKFDVADLPYVKRIDLMLQFPAYTHIATKTIEDSGDIAALKNTAAQITAKLTGKVKAARIVLKDGTKIEMKPGSDNDFVGQVTVKENTSYHIELDSLDGDRYNGTNEHDITVLEDRPPLVTIERPGRDTKATNVEEVFTQVRAEDDYGVTSVDLYYSVNGGEEHKVNLQDLKSDQPKSLSGSHTFFLEEYGLKPGDFISYYAKARDANTEATSDIYFIEVKPFERTFRQVQQQGGGGGGQQDQNNLTKREKDIIAATFRIQREEPTYSAQDKTENYNTVALGQEKLRDDAQGLVDRIKRRMGDQINTQPDFKNLVDCLTQATVEMNSAMKELKAEKAKEALAAEQRALQQLLHADAIFRDIQVSFGNSGGGNGSASSAQDLADLFQLELDKMKNQYETLNREQNQQNQEQEDEAKRKLDELARRQQQQLEQQRQQQQGGPRNGGGGEMSARQQQDLIDETRKMARELDRLSRDRRDQQLQQLSRQLNQAADDMQRAQAASNGNNQQESIAAGLRALDRLEEARKRLEQQSQQGGQGSGQSMQDLRQRAADAAAKQQEVTKALDDLAKRGDAQDKESQDAKQNLMDRKDALANQVDNLEKDIDQAASRMGGDQQKAGDQLREAAAGLRRSQTAERIRRLNQYINNGQYTAAQNGERMVQNSLQDLTSQLKNAEQTASRQQNQSAGAEEALDQTRQLADNLESLRRRLQDNPNGQQGQQAGRQGQQQGQQQNGQSGSPGQQGQQNQQGQQGQAQGQQSQGQQGQQAQNQGQRGRRGQRGQGQRGQQGQQQGQQQAGQQGQQGQSGQQGQAGQQRQAGQQGQSGQQGQQGGQGQQGQQSGQNQNGSGQNPNGQSTSKTMGDPNAAGGGPPMGGSRQLGSELRQRLADAEELRKQIGKTNGDLGRNLDQAIEQLKQLAGNYNDDTQTAARLKTDVIDPLRQVELELSKRLQAKLAKSNLRVNDEGTAPAKYRKQVDEYYKRLSSGSPKQQ